MNRWLGYLAFWLLVPSALFILFHAFAAFAIPVLAALGYAGAPKSVQVAIRGALYVSALAGSAALLWRAWRGLRTEPSAGSRFEFIFRPATGRFFPTDPSGFGPLLRGVRYSGDVVPGWGDHRIRVAGVDVAFQVEESAIRAAFEGEIAEREALAIAEDLRENLERVCGHGVSLHAA